MLTILHVYAASVIFFIYIYTATTIEDRDVLKLAAENARLEAEKAEEALRVASGKIHYLSSAAAVVLAHPSSTLLALSQPIFILYETNSTIFAPFYNLFQF